MESWAHHTVCIVKNVSKNMLQKTQILTQA
jgi:hypothetical protein